MTGFVGISLQFQLLITAHTLNCFLRTSAWRISDWSLLSRFHETHCVFISAREANRTHRLRRFHYRSSWMHCFWNHVLIPKQRFGFLSAYNFQCPYLWKPCFIISWFPRINLSVATCLPIRFLETANMSQYITVHVDTDTFRPVGGWVEGRMDKWVDWWFAGFFW
jgi:hypothetical protein